MDLSGKAAVVTGGTKGIGYAISKSLAEAGADVVLCARDEATVAEVAKRLDEENRGSVLGVRCDMRRPESVEGLITSAVDRFDRLDILINNAGIGAFGPIDELSIETWHQVIETNLNGVFYACHAAVPHMRRGGGGWIINIGSLAGKNPFAGGAAYNASKFGLLGFSEAMMLDVRQDDIRVSCIMPGSVATHFSGPGSHGSTEWKLQPEDVAEMTLDLLSFSARALPSRVEMRPSKPPKR
ncbi:MAG: SDR family oxidoreductase [Gemmatimonas sp.]|nr:SDR family oxidoreductase [Gemmatimonas sp.]